MSEKQLHGTNLKLQNIFCIGRNYSEHAKELNNPVPTTPVVFLKPTSSVCYDGENIILPKQSSCVHHELEVIVVIGKNGKNISESEAHTHISHIGVGLDLTARDLQDMAKEKKLPWTISKGFDTFSAMSAFAPFDGKIETLKNIDFELKINNEIRQVGNTSGMIFSIPYIVSYLSTVFTLSPGDIIYTGTPAGVGPLKAGDIVVAKMKDSVTLSLGVQNAQ
jgi:2-keto-4-pentenoate hydratase/2-oxohepta-3-ene-1,7-dioic acid hydratase in catechol pathway